MVIERVEAKHRNIGGRRYHQTPLGLMPGVTTILSATKNMYGIDKWREDVGEEEADRIRDESIDKGNALHAAIETYFCNPDIYQLYGRSPHGIHADWPNTWDQVRLILDEIDEVYVQEHQVYSLSGYAGSVDLFAKHKGRKRVIDWKTSRKKKSKSKVYDYLMQVSAYIKALNEICNTEVDSGLVVLFVEDHHSPIEFFLDHDDVEEYYQKFLDRLDQYNTHFGIGF